MRSPLGAFTSFLVCAVISLTLYFAMITISKRSDLAARRGAVVVNESHLEIRVPRIREEVLRVPFPITGRNKAFENITLLGVRASCDCMAAFGLPMTVHPRESFSIPMELQLLPRKPSQTHAKHDPAERRDSDTEGDVARTEIQLEVIQTPRPNENPRVVVVVIESADFKQPAVVPLKGGSSPWVEW